MMNEQTLTLPAIIGAALIDSLNPCAFALLLVFVATMLAMLQRQPDAVGAAKARRWLLSRGGIYVLGIFLTYLVLGLGLLAFQEALLPEFGSRLSAHLDMARMRNLVGRLSVPALFGAGVLVGFCTVPCAGSVYLAVLALLAAQSTLVVGIGYLVLYNVVFVAPLVVILVLASSPPVYRKLARWQLRQRLALKLATGVVTIGVGLLTLLVV